MATTDNPENKQLPHEGNNLGQIRFEKTLDIWSLTEEQVKALKPGQWVATGKADEDRSNCGVFCGVKKFGTVVVAWNGNARNSGSAKTYRKTLMAYAKA